jgi:hypothetical protein
LFNIRDVTNPAVVPQLAKFPSPAFQRTATGGVAGGVAGDMTTAQNGVPTPPVKDEKKQAENDALLHTLLKCFHHTIAVRVGAFPNPSHCFTSNAPVTVQTDGR